MVGEGNTFGINRTFGAQEKKFDINTTNGKARAYLNLHYNGDNSYLFINARKVYLSLKSIMKMSSFQLTFI